MIDFASEPLYTLAEAGAMLPGRKPGSRVNQSTVWRWAKEGIKPRRGGPRIVLEYTKLGGRMMTSMAAMTRFAAALTAAGAAHGAPPTLERPTVAQKRRRQQQVEAELDRRGV